jgi:hypothetical protein
MGYKKKVLTKPYRCAKKRDFNSVNDAKSASEGYMKPYKCNVCGKYHLTSRHMK